ncbi:MAG TPA: shikimate dehydrogenase [Ktedonobacteraceae bacterium]|jgi:shikimate dehydrogenase|nr:shikimate dehydrogenase [Ktedonobacteraceae bacterium]
MSSINGETQLIGFFGSTYRTSRMYAMYNAAFEALKLNYVYVPLVVKDLAKAVDGVRHLGIKAVGVTIPYKIDVIPYLDELDEDARRIGAVNAIINQDGSLLGANTDGKGAAKALQEVTTIAGKKVVVLGAGGAARAVAFAIADEGGDVVIVNRTEEMAAALAAAVHGKYAVLNELEQAIQDAGIVIHATPVGMLPGVNESLVQATFLPSRATVMDLVSHPKETRLLQEARARGCTAVYGERMLFWQGVLKFKLYTGIEPPVEVMEMALNNGVEQEG